MRKFRTLASALICITLALPFSETANASPERERQVNTASQQRQGRGGARGGSTGRTPSGSRPAQPGNSSAPSRPAQSNPGSRPGGNNNDPNNNNNRPGSNNYGGGNNNFRPGGNNHGGGNNNFRPGGNNHGNNNFRPGDNHNYGHQPGHGTPPPPPGNHGGPGFTHRPPVMNPPHRPGLPAMRPIWSRPVPPPAWRPYYGSPSFATALGITFGTALMTSLDYLINNGYTVDGYNADQVYLRNVNQMNLMWPDATLYYNNGGLVGSSYVYSTPQYNSMRYYSVYYSLVNQYGQPANILNIQGGMGASWFGSNGAFITLQLAPLRTAGGDIRYFTTLSFGN